MGCVVRVHDLREGELAFADGEYVARIAGWRWLHVAGESVDESTEDIWSEEWFDSPMSGDLRVAVIGCGLSRSSVRSRILVCEGLS